VAPHPNVQPTLPSYTPHRHQQRRRTGRVVRLTVAATVLAALVIGAWFLVSNLTSGDDSPPPPASESPREPDPRAVLDGGPSDLFERSRDLVDDVNQSGPDQQLIDEVLGD
jgi:hypothetical protein